MIELISSNYFPLDWKGKTFIDTFHSMLDGAQELSIASGYCSEESIAELIGLYEKEYSARLDLIIGMHYFEGFSKAQYDGLKYLNQILKDGERGCVYLANRTKYHGKIYLAKYIENNYKSIIGSSNITKLNIMERVFDNDVFTDESTVTGPLRVFFEELKVKNCIPLEEVNDVDIKIEPHRNLFENYIDVQKLDKRELQEKKELATKSKISFEIPMKTTGKSNLNVFFGKGREQANGIILPRDWYEVEIIVPKLTTNQPDYPYCKTFNVFTDDGYSFLCKTSGTNSKNFRSSPDLKILGKWIKGRLENAGVLTAGFSVTDEILEKYGRTSAKLVKIGNDDWFLDFGVRL